MGTKQLKEIQLGLNQRERSESGNLSFFNSLTRLTVHHQGDCQCQLHEEEEAKALQMAQKAQTAQMAQMTETAT